MKAQDGEEVGEYKLTDMHLEHEIIENEDLAREVKDQYGVGRPLGYDYTTLLKTLPWNKDNTHEGGGVVAHEEGCGRQRRVRVPRTDESQRHGGR